MLHLGSVLVQCPKETYKPSYTPAECSTRIEQQNRPIASVYMGTVKFVKLFKSTLNLEVNRLVKRTTLEERKAIYGTLDHLVVHMWAIPLHGQ